MKIEKGLVLPRGLRLGDIIYLTAGEDTDHIRAIWLRQGKRHTECLDDYHSSDEFHRLSKLIASTHKRFGIKEIKISGAIAAYEFVLSDDDVIEDDEITAQE